jgi:hypothetical protein
VTGETLTIDRRAAEEITVAADWYERQSSGVGLDFATAVRLAFAQVAHSPGTCSPAPGLPLDLGVRQCRLERSP